MKIRFVVELERPEGVTVAELREYIASAVDYSRKGEHPESPLFDADLKLRVFKPRQTKKGE